MSDTTTGGSTPPPAPPPPDPAVLAAQKAAQAAASIGAQIILDYNGDGSLGARGGAAATIEENTAARDAHLEVLGLDPLAPSGPPPSPEAIAAKKAAAEAAANEPATPPLQAPTATKVSSLAAGIITVDSGGTTPPDGGGGATAPVNTAVPAVTQSGTTLNCTMGTWTGEPTSYAYQWKLDGTNAGTDAATYDVQAGDVGKAATCVVTATNAGGSTAAPESASVTVA
jgi:hypothetical protein